MLGLLKLAHSEPGYGFIDFSYGRKIFCEYILHHFQRTVGVNFITFDELVTWLLVGENFELVKDKTSRTLDSHHARQIFAQFPSIFGHYYSRSMQVTDEEDLGFPNFYFRVVRPNSPSDVGPVHADCWFWDIRGQSVPANMERLKVWAPLKRGRDYSGLGVLPGSHRNTYSYSQVKGSDGRLRPQFSLHARDKKSFIPVAIEPAQAIVFNDRLLHGGMVADTLRVSVEFTLLVPQEGF
jgi:hypothetical protein